MNRRSFLRTGNCALIGSTSILNTLLNLRLASTVAAQNPAPGDYKALVCLFLNGGNDSFNMLLPTTSGEYSTYAATRSNMAVPLESALNITPDNTPGRTFGVHPAMPHLQAMFDQGDAAFISNVGTMIQPTTRKQYISRSVPLPIHLYSHGDQVVQWQTAINQGQTSVSGWAGRMADIMLSSSPSAGDFFGISVAGRSLFQVGRNFGSYPISPSGAPVLHEKSSPLAFDQRRNEAIKSAVDMEYSNLFHRVYAKEVKRSFDLEGQFNSAYQTSTLTTVFPSTSIGQQLAAVARSIKARTALGSSRQTFFVQDTGYDHHAGLLTGHPPRLSQIDDAVKAFRDAMVEIGLHDEVTLFSVSDFARTLRSNGSGTDHAWGGNQFIIGGAVKGKNLYGDYPTGLTMGSGQDIANNGILLPTTSADQYFAELATWFGISATDLPSVLPNIGNFTTNSVDFL
jgi:uncharacterized protein (DUF1501 family)